MDAALIGLLVVNAVSLIVGIITYAERRQKQVEDRPLTRAQADKEDADAAETIGRAWKTLYDEALARMRREQEMHDADIKELQSKIASLTGEVLVLREELAKFKSKGV